MLNESMETEMNWQLFQLKMKCHKWNSMILSRVFLLSVETKTHISTPEEMSSPHSFRSISIQFVLTFIYVFINNKVVSDRRRKKENGACVDRMHSNIRSDILSFNMKHARASCHCTVHSVGKFSISKNVRVFYADVWNNKMLA